MVINKHFRSTQFVFDLFLEGKTTLLYTTNISNSLTNIVIDNINLFSISSLKSLFIVKDIPSYLDVKLKEKNSSIKTKRINQYKGYLVNLFNYDNAEDYLKENLSKRNRKNLFSKLRRLEQNHEITNNVYFGNIDKNHFESIFNTFHSLLTKRFQEKKIDNRYLSKWDDLKALSYEKILDKKASLHVIFDRDKPITITLNFHQSDILFSHIQTYDINYSSYNMGDISMLNHLKWCIANHITVFDLAIEKSNYKDKWCNYEYDFFYQIHYNSKSLISNVLSKIVYLEFKTLKFLRDKNIIGNLFNFDKILYKVKALKN